MTEHQLHVCPWGVQRGGDHRLVCRITPAQLHKRRTIPLAVLVLGDVVVGCHTKPVWRREEGVRDLLAFAAEGEAGAGYDALREGEALGPVEVHIRKKTPW